MLLRSGELSLRSHARTPWLFFGTHMFLMNVGIAIANQLFSSLVRLGKSVTNPLGVPLSGVAALGFCALGLVLFWFYDEEAVTGNSPPR